MLEFLIRLFLTLSTGGNPCDLGTDTDWYDWVNAHQDAQVVMQFNPIGETNIWLFQSGDILVEFVFKDDPELVAAAGGHTPHGQCARLVSGTDS